MKEEKTEKPTPKKIKDARKEGQVARTPEIGAWVSMLVAGFLIHKLVGWGSVAIRELILRSTAMVAHPSTEAAMGLLRDGFFVAMGLSLALGAGVLVIGVATAAGQGGIHLATKTLKPKWSRLNPLEGAKRLFGPHALWEGAKILIKSTMVALLVWRAVDRLLPLLGGLLPMAVAIELGAAQAGLLIRDVAIAGLVTAFGDYAIARRRTGKQTRMTKHEVKQEHKQADGDPLVKHAIRSRQLASARNRMMADIPQADVVLVNPTHVAVALRYSPEHGAPRVVAKGAGAIATRIRERATEHRVPIVEDIPLARALHGSCEIGHDIPAELYQAVAQVLAFVLSRRNQGSAAGRHRSPRPETELPRVIKAGRRRRTVSTEPANTSGALALGR